MDSPYDVLPLANRTVSILAAIWALDVILPPVVPMLFSARLDHAWQELMLLVMVVLIIILI